MTINRVLVCDDSNTDITNIKTIVEDAGYEVFTASNGSEALDAAKEKQPDIIFLDIIMPEMDGYETCRKLQEDAVTKEIPVIFVTSKGQKADRLWAQMQGGSDLITKPYTSDQIVKKLEEY